MKKILGLDLGTNSIGWAVVCHSDTDGQTERKWIEMAGSRIIPMDAAILGDFDKGNSKSQTSERTGFRGIRRLRERVLLRRERLHKVLKLIFPPDDAAHFLRQFSFALLSGGKPGPQLAACHRQRLHGGKQDASARWVQQLCLCVQRRGIADIPAGDHHPRNAQDILPAVPALKAEQHIAANGKVQHSARVFPCQHFQREHGIIAAARCGLRHLPAAYFQRRHTRLLRQRRKAPAHFQPQRTGGVCPLLKRRGACRHHHDLIRVHTVCRCTQIIQVAVMGRVEAAAIEKDLHLTSAGQRRRCPFSFADTARTWSR